MKHVLNLVIKNSDAGDNITIKQYLKALLTALWTEKEGFSGKRALGNSGWDYDLLQPLVAAKFIDGTLDEDGNIESCDEQQGHELILKAIQAL